MAEVDETGLPLHPPELEGKSADEPTIVRWVARNIAVARPDPAECPDPFAWSLLLQLRRDPDRQAWFTEKLWAKLIPSRSQLDTTGDKAIDGKELIDRLDKIAKIAEASRVAPRAKKRPKVEVDLEAFEAAEHED